MAQVHFQLHNKGENGRDIRLTYLCKDGKYFTKPTGEKTKFWNKKDERVPPSAKDAKRINDLLDQMSDKVLSIVGQLRLNGRKITRAAIKELWEEKAVGDFWLFANPGKKRKGEKVYADEGEFFRKPPADCGKSAIKGYRSAMNLLIQYEEQNKLSIGFSSFTQPFIDAVLHWMRGEEYMDSYIDKTLNKIHSILGYAKEGGYIKERIEFRIRTIDLASVKVYLSEPEIETFYAQRNNKTLITVYGEKKVHEYIDCFVLGTQIGVRVSDLRIEPGQIINVEGEAMINLSQQKTITPVIIPLSPLAKEVGARYGWQIPKFTDQKMNIFIKKVARIAGIVEPVITRAIVGGKLKEEIVPKCDLIGTHTMRRSFATNMYKLAISLGVGRDLIPMIMRITGHKSISSFLKYICIDETEAAKIMLSFMNKEAGKVVKMGT